MKKKIAVLTAFTIIFTGALSSCAVGEKVPKLNKETSKSDAAPVSESLASGSTAESSRITAYKSEEIKIPDGIHYLNNVSRLNENELLIQACDENDAAIYYKTDLSFSKFTELGITFPNECYEADYHSVITSFNSDGSFIAFILMEDHGGLVIPDEYDESFDYDAYNENCECSYMLCRYDKDCNLLSSVPIEFSEDYYDRNDYLSLNYIEADGDSVIASFGNGQICRINCDDGKLSDLYEAEQSELSYSQAPLILRDRDGNLTFGIYCGEENPDSNESALKLSLCRYNEDGTISESIYTSDADIINFSYSITAGYGEYLYLLSVDEGLFGIREDGNTEKLIDWTESNMTYVPAIEIEDNEYICYINDDDVSSLLRLVPRDPSETANLKEITIGTFSEMDDAIVQFNASQDKYRINMVNYFDYSIDEITDGDDYDKKLEEVQQKLSMDIISGNAPDMILGLDYNFYLNLRNKGVFTDLDQFLDSDKHMGRDAFMPNILKAMEAPDGKIYAMASGFSFDTIIAKTRLCDKENWTLDEMIDYYDNAPAEAVHIYDGDSKMDMFKTMLYSMEDLIDYDNGTCDFDNPEFVKMLEFCNRFVDEVERPDKMNDGDNAVQDYWTDKYTWFARDLVIAERLTFFDLTEYSLVKNLEGGGEDMTLVGYPSKNGKGGRITPNDIICITAGCEEKEAAWEFIKYYIQYCYKQQFEQLPVLVEDFNADMVAAMVEKHTAGGAEYPAYTKQEADMLTNYINGCDEVGTVMDNSLWSICEEHAQEYFSGGKTAEEAAKMIQNRVSILISERT